ncbi:hypothetical protein, partial [Microbacterium sp.]|uniref:hypothetical protein n=1 Tax=Microbacterium sp. TaxID=51671 RepID=UPI0027364E1F
AERAWIVGGSPTAGFLTNAVKGPFVDVFHGLAGSPTVDWLFMLGLAGIGFALLAGVATRLAGYAGATLLIMMYLALMFPTTNPFLDEHLIYAGLLIGVAHAGPGAWAPLAGWWKKSPLSKFPFLR